jgi:hypothetical protein
MRKYFLSKPLATFAAVLIVSILSMLIINACHKNEMADIKI